MTFMKNHMIYVMSQLGDDYGDKGNWNHDDSDNKYEKDNCNDNDNDNDNS